MSAYLIVGRWLLEAGEEEHQAWALDDLQSRFSVLKEVIADPDVDDETKGDLREQVSATEEAIHRYGAAATPTSMRKAKKLGESVPSLQLMAKTAGLSLSTATRTACCRRQTSMRLR